MCYLAGCGKLERRKVFLAQALNVVPADDLTSIPSSQRGRGLLEAPGNPKAKGKREREREKKSFPGWSTLFFYGEV